MTRRFTIEERDAIKIDIARQDLSREEIILKYNISEQTYRNYAKELNMSKKHGRPKKTETEKTIIEEKDLELIGDENTMEDEKQEIEQTEIKEEKTTPEPEKKNGRKEKRNLGRQRYLRNVLQNRNNYRTTKRAVNL